MARLVLKGKLQLQEKIHKPEEKYRGSIKDQNITTRERAAANTIRSRASPTFSIFIKESGRTTLFNVS